MKFQPVIKWSGSKRSQSEEIIKHFPKEFNTYYEPFVGGASVLYRLLNSDIKVNKYICSDINNDLITFWNYLKENPEKLVDNYTILWKEINSIEDIEERKKYYYEVRKRFNKNKSVDDFNFLTRNSVNGLIRYNSKGEFNAPYHFSRKGIEPNRLSNIVREWSDKLNQHEVQFINRSYLEIESKENDVLYLDPPYANTAIMYHGTLDYNEFWGWMRSQKGKYYLSFDGKRDSGVDNTYDVPNDLYSSHIYLYSGISGFQKLHNSNEYVKESLYIN